MKQDNERVQDLLCCALEGGSNYWYTITDFIYPEGQTNESLAIKFRHLELPFKGGALVIVDQDGDVTPIRQLDRASIRKGLAVMHKNYPRHYADWKAENEDAITGDVFLQCCIFGEVIFS